MTVYKASSGHYSDIQDAVDEASAGDIVYAPEGTFNFVNVSESWVEVDVPAGINVFGAPTERTHGIAYDGNGINPNNQVVSWKTILKMPEEAPNNSRFFHFEGTQQRNLLTRFSDIKLVGYRDIDSESETEYRGVQIDDILNFRVDHCYFRNLAGHGVRAEVGDYGQWGKKEIGRYWTGGLVDHCYLVNTHGDPDWATHTLLYGVYPHRGSYSEEWENDIRKVLGYFTDYTTIIEDCYFEKWRHDICSNFGGHYVARHNTFKDAYSRGTIDAHGWGKISNGRVLVGTRAIEVYNNKFDNSIPPSNEDTINVRGGGGVIFNNIVTGYDRYFIHMTQEAEDAVEKCQVNDLWIWNNDIGELQEVYVYSDKNPITENVHYYLRAPNRSSDGYEYTPYPYPHPLAVPIQSNKWWGDWWRKYSQVWARQVA